jgi:hypothetical protein
MEYYPRKIEKKLEKWLQRKEIILLKGPRQAGKTTLFLHLKEKIGGDYVTLEDEDILKTFNENPKGFAKRFGNRFLFIDEAQYSRDVGKRLKLLFDLFSDKLKLFVTGSGSFDIKVEVGKYLVGRAAYFELFPLDFEEFLLWKEKDLYKIFLDYKKTVIDFIDGKDIKIEPIFEREFKTCLEEYLTFGGFPAIVKEEDEDIKRELLKNLVRTYIEKDVFFFMDIRHLEKFRNVLAYLSLNVGSLLEISSVMREMGVDYKTAYNYINILANTYIVFLIPPFHRNRRTELKKSKKVYFGDVGLRNAIVDNFLPLDKRVDKGHILENFIFNELRLNFGDRVKYWRTTGKAEVDFVLTLEDRIVPIEVKSQTKLRRGFRSFLKVYSPERALVFSEKTGIKKIGDTKIAFIPHYFI